MPLSTRSPASLFAPPAAARLLALVLAVAGSAAAGCVEVRLVSDYDERTDERLSALQENIEALLTDLEGTLGTPRGSYARYAPRYDSLRVGLRALSVRATARPRNRLQVDQLAEVMRQLDLFAQAHRAGMEAAEVAPFRRGFNQSFRAMIRLELAKKRGERE